MVSMVDTVRAANGINISFQVVYVPSSEFATIMCGENVMSLWTVQPNSVKV